MAVAADDRRARQGQAELRADDVDDPLVAALHVVERDPELAAVGAEGFHLPARHGLANFELILGGNVVVERGEREVAAADLTPSQS